MACMSVLFFCFVLFSFLFYRRDGFLFVYQAGRGAIPGCYKGNVMMGGDWGSDGSILAFFSSFFPCSLV